MDVYTEHSPLFDLFLELSHQFKASFQAIISKKTLITTDSSDGW